MLLQSQKKIFDILYKIGLLPFKLLIKIICVNYSFLLLLLSNFINYYLEFLRIRFAKNNLNNGYVRGTKILLYK